jgi:1-acyl-sn-glycerol-3-phosphate acyltransferase
MSNLWMRWFAAYARRYLARHFHAVRVSRCGVPRVPFDGSLVLYLNHASWWDPLVALVFTREFFPQRSFSAPIDAAALERYGILKRAGFFGVEQGTARGARQFLRGSAEALEDANGGLCLTPQGRFTDVRVRPLGFKTGIGELAFRRPGTAFLPVAVEYAFWQERSPEVLVKFGATVTAEPHLAADAKEWTLLLEQRLAATMDALALESQSRDANAFQALMNGSAGIGGPYDLWRTARARLRGESFDPQHSPP